MGFCETLFCIFLVLKLCGVIDWGWLAVFSPLIVAFLFGVFATLYVRFH